MAAEFVNESKTVLRFSDTTELPQEMLPPIQGYENQPLVSLLRSDQKFVHCYWQFLRPINIGLIFFINK